jgi:methylglutamate dehydrogenase subunit D
VHHNIFAQIQRTGPDQFDVYVFRSFARSFWNSLCHASEEVGYEIR